MACGREPLSWSDVQEELVEAVRMLWRMPGGGRWPFAGDGPWHLITRAARAGSAMDVWRQEQDEVIRDRSRPLSAVPLTAEEVTWMEGRLAWLETVGERDRKLVVLVLRQLAAGAQRIDWGRVKRKLGAEIGNKGVYRRYSRAIEGIAVTLNRRMESAAA